MLSKKIRERMKCGQTRLVMEDTTGQKDIAGQNLEKDGPILT